MVYLDYGPSLPAGYGGNEITAMLKDPEWVFVYWEVESLNHLSLRVFDETQGATRFIPVSQAAGAWYIPVSPDSTYVIEVGRNLAGEFIAMARSNRVRTPRKGAVAGFSYTQGFRT